MSKNNIRTNGLLNFKGPYGEQQQPHSAVDIHHEPLKTRSEFYHFEINEHLHTDLTQIFIITDGGGLLFSEGKKIALNSPCILIIPNGTLHGFFYQSEVKGDVFSIPTSFLENCFTSQKKVWLEFNKLQQLDFENNSCLFDEIMDYKSKIVAEVSTHKPEKKQVLELLFQIFIMFLYRAIKDKPIQVLKSDNRVLSYFNAFQKNIKLNIHETKSIKEYASDLNITSVHLNRICKSLVKKSALQVVHDYLHKEAKKYLSGSDNSITEISYLLNFKEPSHFSKFFKKMEGISPKQFREQLI